MDQPSINSCPICLNVVEEHMKCITQCGHTFHNRCIFRWLRNHNNCPTCRCVLNADDTDGETDLEMVTPPLEEEEEIRTSLLSNLRLSLLLIERELELGSETDIHYEREREMILHRIQQEEIYIGLHNAPLDAPRHSFLFDLGNESLVARPIRRP